MRTLWVGILEDDVMCHSHHAADLVVDLREGRTINISEKLIVRAIRRIGTIRGYGLVIAQSSDPSVQFSENAHEQYLWLVEGWLISNGIGPKEKIRFFTEDVDVVPDAPEAWN